MDYIISAAGLLLAVAPWIFRFSSNTTAMVISLVLGAVICVAAGYRALSKDAHKWEEWTVVVAGVLAIAAPFIFGFSTPALWSSLILGVIAAVLAVYQAFKTQGGMPGKPA